MDQVIVRMAAPAFVIFGSRGIECAIRIAGTTDGHNGGAREG